MQSFCLQKIFNSDDFNLWVKVTIMFKDNLCVYGKLTNTFFGRTPSNPNLAGDFDSS